MPENIEKIILENIYFSYRGNSVLRNFSFDFSKGIIGIRGANGSGKSTLISLILKSIIPDKGFIKINDINLEDIRYDEIQKKIAYVGAKQILYNLSVKENLLMFDGSESVTEYELNRIIQLVNLDEDIQNLPNRIETILSDNNGLSIGQIQKIEIARAILKNTTVMLFDEAFSNVDIDTKSKIFHYLSSIKDKKIIILVSHNYTDYDFCDRVIQLNK